MRQFQQQDGGFFEAATGRFIPDDMANVDRQEIDTLVAAGEAEILPADEIPPPAPTLSAQELQTIFEAHGTAEVKAAIAARLSEKSG